MRGLAVAGICLALLSMCDGSAYADPVEPAVATAQAVRLMNFDMPPIVIEEQTGLNGMSFAPPWLSGCAEMDWWFVQAGLPLKDFHWRGVRESNCINRDDVRTWCCHGYLQLYISLWITDHRLGPLLAACDVRSHEDVNSNTPLDKQRQACAAKAAYDVVGLSPWATS